jgi:hypothetical protein
VDACRNRDDIAGLCHDQLRLQLLLERRTLVDRSPRILLRARRNAGNKARNQ